MKTARRKTSEQLARLCSRAALDKKGEDIVILDLRRLSTITDFFVIVSGTSEPHLKAVMQEIEKRLAAEGEFPRAVDGTPHSQWIVMDYTDVIVHIFRPTMRERYGLEYLWGDAPTLKP